MSRQNETGRPRRLPLQALVLAVACGWLLLVLSVLVSPSVFAFGATLAPSPTDTPPVCVSCTTPTPTDTPTIAATKTRTPTVTISPTATATSAGGGNGGGGGGGNQGGGGPAGPNVTRVVYSQATVGASDNGPLQGLTPSALGDNGLLLASTLGCVVGLLGIIIGAIALMVLVRGGYGPFLKALLRGKRAGRKRGKQNETGVAPAWSGAQGAGTGYHGAAGYGPAPQRGRGNTSGFRGGYGDDDYGPPPGRSASRTARPPAQNTRSRKDWR